MNMVRHYTWRIWAVVAAIACAGMGPALAAEPEWGAVTARLNALALPGDAADAIVRQAEANKVPPSTVMGWQAALEQAQKSGLPAAVMAERISQGLAKGVPAGRINQGLTALQANLAWGRALVESRVAKAALRDNPAGLELSLRQLDAALRSGLERAQIEQILDARQLTLDQCVSLARTAAELRGYGVDAARVIASLQPAGRAGVTAAELDRLGRQFAQGRGADRSVADLLAEFDRGVNRLRDPVGPDRDQLRQEMKQDPSGEWRRPPSMENPMQGGGLPGGGGSPGF